MTDPQYWTVCHSCARDAQARAQAHSMAYSHEVLTSEVRFANLVAMEHRLLDHEVSVAQV